MAGQTSPYDSSARVFSITEQLIHFFKTIRMILDIAKLMPLSLSFLFSFELCYLLFELFLFSL